MTRSEAAGGRSHLGSLNQAGSIGSIWPWGAYHAHQVPSGPLKDREGRGRCPGEPSLLQPDLQLSSEIVQCGGGKLLPGKGQHAKLAQMVSFATIQLCR